MSILEQKTQTEISKEWADIARHSTPRSEAKHSTKIIFDEGPLASSALVWERVFDERGLRHTHKQRQRIVRKETGSTIFDSGWQYGGGGVAKFNAACKLAIEMESRRKEVTGCKS